MIGPIPSWCGQAFLSGNAQFAQVARVNALLQCGWNCWINEATGKVPTVVGNTNLGASGNFPGLGENFRDVFWLFPGDSPGAVAASTGAGGPGPWFSYGDSNAYDWSHNPDSMHYTIVTEGGAHIIDSQIIYTNGGPWANDIHGGSINNDWYFSLARQMQVLPTSTNHYYGLINASQTRAVGWKLRSFTHARATMPDSWPEQAYFDYLMKNTAAWAVERISVMPANMVAAGWWVAMPGITSYPIFMHGFVARSVAHAAFLFGDPNMQTWAFQMLKLYSGFTTDWPGNCAVAFNALGWACNSSVAMDNRNNFLLFPRVSTYYGTGFADGCQTVPDYTTNSFNVTYSRGYLPFIQFPLAHGDILYWPFQTHDSYSMQGKSYILPSGINHLTPYYIINLSGSEPNFNHQLSLTPHGSAVTFTDKGNPNNGGSFFELAAVPKTCPTSLADIDANAPLTEAFGTTATAVACGFSSVSSAYSALKALTDANLKTTTFPADPVWAMVGTF
jgi:hypothetical protein